VTLTQLFSGFARSSVTHLRIVVNHCGIWLSDFGPQYVMELAKLIPDLEELSLDQKGMPAPAPLPGCLVSATLTTCDFAGLSPPLEYLGRSISDVQETPSHCFR
jgi:hypothetical protein